MYLIFYLYVYKIKITGLETLTDRAPEIPDRNSYKTQLTGVNDLWRDHGKQSKIGLKLQTNLFDCLHFYYIFLIFSPHPHSFANAEVAVTEIRRKQVARTSRPSKIAYYFYFLFKQHILNTTGLPF